MKFRDTSAAVPLLIDQPASTSMQAVARTDPSFIVWWGTAAECASALARLERDDAIDNRGIKGALGRLALLTATWHEVDSGDLVRETAIRLLRVHPLRAADSLQLAAAFLAAEGRPPTLEFVTLDDRLARAAQREGFIVGGTETDPT